MVQESAESSVATTSTLDAMIDISGSAAALKAKRNIAHAEPQSVGLGEGSENNVIASLKTPQKASSSAGGSNGVYDGSGAQGLENSVLSPAMSELTMSSPFGNDDVTIDMCELMAGESPEETEMVGVVEGFLVML